MEYDKDKTDEATLALMWLVAHSDKYGSYAWKSFDWLNHLLDLGQLFFHNYCCLFLAIGKLNPEKIHS
jgi:hypothetical protein